MRLNLVNLRQALFGLFLLSAFAATANVRANADADPGSVEDAFAAARNYTVYIETRIEIPFVEDDAGSYIGAGFVVDRERGWVMTNAHVIGHSPARLDVFFADGAKTPAAPLYIDSFLDLAIVQLPNTLTQSHGEARLDCDTRPSIGVPVGAYGHPNNFKFTGTRGIVSGYSTRTGATGLQTDAPINAGNSGGPLIRLDTGAVVGINTESLVGERIQNMNFAVQMPYACRVLALLRESRDPRPAAFDAMFYTVEGEPTLTVARAGALAAAAGLRAGDRIVDIDDATIEPANLPEFMHRLRGLLGEDVALRVNRNGRDTVLRLPVEPEAAVLARRGFMIDGALFAETRYQDAALLVDRPKLMVHYVVRGSAAESAGLAPFDQLVGVGGIPVDEVDELAQRFTAAPDSVVDLEVIRLVTGTERFTRHIRASLPVEHGQWIALEQSQESRAAVGFLSGSPPARVDFASAGAVSQ